MESSTFLIPQSEAITVGDTLENQIKKQKSNDTLIPVVRQTFASTHVPTATAADEPKTGKLCRGRNGFLNQEVDYLPLNPRNESRTLSAILSVDVTLTLSVFLFQTGTCGYLCPNSPSLTPGSFTSCTSTPSRRDRRTPRWSVWLSRTADVGPRLEDS